MPDFLPDRLESGTVNTSGIIGLSAGVGFVLQNTPKKLYLHEMQLCDYLYQKLCGIRGVTLYSDRPCLGRNLPLIALNLKNINPETAAEALNRHHIAVRAGFHCAALAHQKMGTDRYGTIRVSLGAFNHKNEADAFCMAVKTHFSRKVAVQKNFDVAVDYDYKYVTIKERVI